MSGITISGISYNSSVTTINSITYYEYVFNRVGSGSITFPDTLRDYLVDFLVVGGGASGATYNGAQGGQGGGGGVYLRGSLNLTQLVTYSISVGSGGIWPRTTGAGSNIAYPGSSSSFFSYTAAGGTVSVGASKKGSYWIAPNGQTYCYSGGGGVGGGSGGAAGAGGGGAYSGGTPATGGTPGVGGNGINGFGAGGVGGRINNNLGGNGGIGGHFNYGGGTGAAGNYGGGGGGGGGYGGGGGGIAYQLTTINPGEASGANGVVVLLVYFVPYPCFKEGSKILTINGYRPIETLRKGDLIKTLLDDYKAIDMIGSRDIYHKASKDRIKDQLYKCSKEFYPDIWEDLVLTGCHSILIDNFKSEEQKNKAIEVNGNLYITDDKYRLPACVDDRTTVYETPGKYTIYHLALENDNYYYNYGIYANGLLVETSSKRYMKELSGMELIE